MDIVLEKLVLICLLHTHIHTMYGQPIEQEITVRPRE